MVDKLWVESMRYHMVDKLWVESMRYHMVDKLWVESMRYHMVDKLWVESMRYMVDKLWVESMRYPWLISCGWSLYLYRTVSHFFFLCPSSAAMFVRERLIFPCCFFRRDLFVVFM